MNHEVLEKILRRVQGPNWVRPNWLTSKRAGRFDFKTQEPAGKQLPPKQTDDSLDSIVETASCPSKPYINRSGELVIPTLGPKKYRYWDGGQSVLKTLAELGANDDVIKKYSGPN